MQTRPDLAPDTRPGTRLQPRKALLSGETVITAARPLPCPEAVALPAVSAATHRQPETARQYPGAAAQPRPIAAEVHLADVLAWHRFGGFQLLVTAAVICCGDWSARRARAASRAAGVSAARMVASVRAYPAGYTGGSSTPVCARSASRAPAISAARAKSPWAAAVRPGPPGTTAGTPGCRWPRTARRRRRAGPRPGVVAVSQVHVAGQRERHGRAPAVVVPAGQDQALREHLPGAGPLTEVQQSRPEPAQVPGRGLLVAAGAPLGQAVAQVIQPAGSRR